MYEHLFIFSYLENLHFLSRAFPHFKISIPKKKHETPAQCAGVYKGG